MTTTRGATEARRRRTDAKQGMALLLVLVLIVMVSAAGVFAAQSSGLEVRSAGFMRQASQTHYVAETGVTASLTEMRRFCTAYMGIMQAQQRTATRDPWLEEPRLQYNFGIQDFARPPSGGGPVIPMFRDPTGVGASRQPGSFGMGRIAAAFNTQALVLGRVQQPVFGFGVGGARDLTVPMLAIEFNSNGRTLLQGVTDLNQNAVGNESARVVGVIPCL